MGWGSISLAALVNRARYLFVFVSMLLTNLGAACSPDSKNCRGQTDSGVGATASLDWTATASFIHMPGPLEAARVT